MNVNVTKYIYCRLQDVDLSLLKEDLVYMLDVKKHSWVVNPVKHPSLLTTKVTRWPSTKQFPLPEDMIFANGMVFDYVKNVVVCKGYQVTPTVLLQNESFPSTDLRLTIEDVDLPMYSSLETTFTFNEVEQCIIQPCYEGVVLRCFRYDGENYLITKGSLQASSAFYKDPHRNFKEASLRLAIYSTRLSHIPVISCTWWWDTITCAGELKERW